MDRIFKFTEQIDEYGNAAGYDEAAAIDVVLKLLGTLDTVGGMFAVSAIREQVDQDEYATTGLIVRWDSYAPANKKPKPVMAEDEVDEGEPVAAGHAD